MILTRGKLETILAFEKMKIHAELKGESISRAYRLHTEINELKEEIARLKETIEELIQVAAMCDKAVMSLAGEEKTE